MDVIFILGLIVAIGVIFVAFAIFLTREKDGQSSRTDVASDGGFWGWFDGTSDSSGPHHHGGAGGGHHGGHYGGDSGGGHHGGGFDGSGHSGGFGGGHH